MKLTERGYNFSAGPATLPESILRETRRSLLNWRSTGMSILEVPHHSDVFIELLKEAEEGLRNLISIPNNYHVLFIGGPARAQFSMIPINFIGDHGYGGYIVSGLWSHKAWRESQRLKPTVCVASSEETAFNRAPIINKDLLNDNIQYVFYTPNETVNGVQNSSPPEVDGIPIIADMTSFILSEPLDVSQFALIFAGAQKLIANAGLTIVIVHDNFIDKIRHQDIPFLLDYRSHITARSLAATPPTFNCYLASLMFEWIKEQGGLSVMQQRNLEKSQLLYSLIDKSNLYHCAIQPEDRSVLNVCFRLRKPNLEGLFLKKASQNGLLSLKGYPLAGGIRASLYNAMPIEGVHALVSFMAHFEEEYG